MEGIKFRVWDKVANKWLDYEDIYLDQEGEVYLIEERNWAYQTYMHKENRTEKVEIVRFTGLRDKNGKEIYEGDIVRISGHPFQGSINIDGNYDVGYNELMELCCGGWYLHRMRHWAEVIGNIYENPELLGASK